MEYTNMEYTMNIQDYEINISYKTEFILTIIDDKKQIKAIIKLRNNTSIFYKPFYDCYIPFLHDDKTNNFIFLYMNYIFRSFQINKLMYFYGL